MSANTETTGAANSYGLEAGQVWQYLPKANLGCETRTIAMVDGGLHPTEDGVSTCDDLEWFVSNAVLISSPPIAAPAAHVERRKGQRWKCEWGGQSIDAIIIGERTDLDTWPMTDGDYWADSRWTGKGSIGSVCTMTLLTDAPPEPAKHSPNETLHGLGSDDPYIPPAQEAPKAAPVCGSKKAEGFAIPLAAGQMWDRTEIGDVWTLTTVVRFGPYAGQWNAIDQRGEEGIIGPDDLTDVGAVLLGARPLRKELIAAPKLGPCDDCGDTDGVKWFLFDDMMRTFCEPCRTGAAAWMAAQTGAPYDGPERLPRPQLAADWVEDCLPESGR